MYYYSHSVRMSELLHGLKYNKGESVHPIKSVSVIVINAGHGDATLIKVTDTSGNHWTDLFFAYCITDYF